MTKDYEPTMHPHPVARKIPDSLHLGVASLWPDEMVELAKREWERGTSASQIASMINAQWPKLRKTRNAIVGKIHRMGLGSTRPLALADRARIAAPIAWTEALDLALRRNHAAGLGAVAISRKLYADFNLTISSRLIVARLVAIGARAKGVKTRGPGKYGHAPFGDEHEPMLPEIIEAAPETSTPMHETAFDACKWPTSNDLLSMEVCGQPAKIGAYCAKHGALAYTRMPDRKRNDLFFKRNEYDRG
jgi:hypothetical protein